MLARLRFTAYPLLLTALLAVPVTSCTSDNPVGRFIGTVGGCISGNTYRFNIYGSPSINILQIENQLPQVTAKIPLEVGRPCEALQGVSSTVQGIRMLRDGAPIANQGDFSAGIYTLRFSDQVQPRRIRYEVQAATDANPAASVLGRIPLDVDATSPIQGFPRLSVNAPNLPQARMSWTPATGHSGYRLQFSYDDANAPGTKRVALMHLAPEVTSYVLGELVKGDATIEEGRTIGLPAAIADNRGTGLKPGLRLTVTVGAFHFQPGTAGDRLASGTDWEHRSLPLTLAP